MWKLRKYGVAIATITVGVIAAVVSIAGRESGVKRFNLQNLRSLSSHVNHCGKDTCGEVYKCCLDETEKFYCTESNDGECKGKWCKQLQNECDDYDWPTCVAFMSNQNTNSRHCCEEHCKSAHDACVELNPESQDCEHDNCKDDDDICLYLFSDCCKYCHGCFNPPPQCSICPECRPYEVCHCSGCSCPNCPECNTCKRLHQSCPVNPHESNTIHCCYPYKCSPTGFCKECVERHNECNVEYDDCCHGFECVDFDHIATCRPICVQNEDGECHGADDCCNDEVRCCEVMSAWRMFVFQYAF